MVSHVEDHVRVVVLLGRRGAVALARVAVVGHGKKSIWELES